MNNNQNKISELIFNILKGKIKIHYPDEPTLIEDIRARANEIAYKIEQHRKQQLKKYILLFVVFSLAYISVIAYLMVTFVPSSKNITTEPGTTKKVYFKNSTIYLNADTHIKVHQYNNGKSIQLLNGEIYIHNPNNEYIEIITKDKVVVFFNGNINVISRDDYFKVITENTQATLHSKNNTSFIPEHHYLSEYKNSSSLQPLEKPVNVALFRDGFLNYNQDPISFILKDIEATYNIDIQFKTIPKIEKNTFSGVFPIESKPADIIRYLIPDCFIDDINPTTIIIDCERNLSTGDPNQR